jgi:uncharacterized membrane protein
MAVVVAVVNTMVATILQSIHHKVGLVAVAEVLHMIIHMLRTVQVNQELQILAVVAVVVNILVQVLLLMVQVGQESLLLNTNKNALERGHFINCVCIY